MVVVGVADNVSAVVVCDVVGGVSGGGDYHQHVLDLRCRCNMD
jgi:hypothetical protein